MTTRFKKYAAYLRRRAKEDRGAFVLYTVLRTIVILAAVRHAMNGDYEAVATCILALILFLVPGFMEERFKFKLPPVFEGIIYVFIYAAEILGEVNSFYVKIPIWDTMLHTTNGFLCAAIGFSLIYLLNRNSKNVKLSPLYLTFMAFCFSMTVGVIWEFIEFGADYFLGMDMQKDFIVQTINSVKLDPDNSQAVIHVTDILSTTIHTANGDVVVDGGYLDIGIYDTMKDLFVNFIGAVVFCTFGYIYCKQFDRGETPHSGGRLAANLLVKVVDEEDAKQAEMQAEAEVEDMIEQIREARKSKKESLATANEIRDMSRDAASKA